MDHEAGHSVPHGGDQAHSPTTHRESSWKTVVSRVRLRAEHSQTPFTESPADIAARLTANATVWLAAFTVILAMISLGTLWILYNQLNEMKSGGVDTHELATAAEKQADAAKAQSDETKLQVEKMQESLNRTDTLIRETTAQAIATNELAAQSKRSADSAIIQTSATNQLAAQTQRTADISARQLEISQRAWIHLDKGTVTSIRLIDENAVSMGLRLDYSNTGNLPAYRVKMNPYLYFAKVEGDRLADAKNLQKALCEDDKTAFSKAQYRPVQTVYPHESGSFSWTSNGGGAGVFENDHGYTPVIVGCISYQFSSSLEVHQSPFILYIRRKSPEGELLYLQLGKNVPLSDVVVIDSWNGEAETNSP